MDDYDWMNDNQSGGQIIHLIPAPMSIMPMNTISAQGWLFQDDNYKAGVIAGYQETRFSWTATGGSTTMITVRRLAIFRPVSGIGYSQRFSMPYIGLAGQYRINDFEFNALFKFSDWVRAHDNDEHYMRELTFEKSTNSRYYGTSVDAGYYITPHAKVFTEFTYSKYEEGKEAPDYWIPYSGESASIEEMLPALQIKTLPSQPDFNIDSKSLPPVDIASKTR